MPVCESQPLLLPHGDAVCEVVEGQSVLTRTFARSPLKLLTPRTYDHSARLVTSTFGGGLVSGDSIDMRLRVGPGASCVLTTQSAGKVYRSIGATCRQTTTATVGDDALLVVMPDPLYCFADARYEQRQRFDLASSGNLVWLDILTSGRRARGESWAFQTFASRTDVTVAGQLRIREVLRLDRDDPFASISERLGGFTCYATLVMIGPKLSAACDQAGQAAGGLPPRRDARLLATTSSIDGGLLMRVLACETEPMLQYIHNVLGGLSGVIGGDLFARKW